MFIQTDYITFRKDTPEFYHQDFYKFKTFCKLAINFNFDTQMNTKKKDFFHIKVSSDDN